MIENAPDAEKDFQWNESLVLGVYSDMEASDFFWDELGAEVELARWEAYVFSGVILGAT